MAEKWREHKKVIIGVVVAVFVFLGLLLWILETELPKGQARLTAQSENAQGVAPDTMFVLKVSPSPASEAALREMLVFEPAVSYAVMDQGGGEYLIVPDQLLPAGGQVVAWYGSQSFTFTVRGQLMVTSHFPYDDAYNVPTSSGVEFQFNSDEITAADLKDAFSISPEVAGSFTRAAGRYVFYPTDPFEENTAYAVTLEGLATKDGATLAAPFTFSFTTGSMEGYEEQFFQMYGNGVSTNALAGETALFRAYVDASLRFGPDTPMEAEVFAFDGWKDYAKELKKCVGGSPAVKVNVDTAALQPVVSHALRPQSAGENDYTGRGSWVLQLPETLPEGHYLVRFSFSANGTEYVRQHFLQVSHYSFFYMLSDSNLLAWLNDASTGQPVEGADISIDGSHSAKASTGADGTAVVADVAMPTSRDGGRFGTLMTVRAGDDVFVDLNNYYYYGEGYGSYGSSSPQGRRYIAYLYTDRPLYQTTDTIQVWGVARSRDTEITPRPQKATLKLSS